MPSDAEEEDPDDGNAEPPPPVWIEILQMENGHLFDPDTNTTYAPMSVGSAMFRGAGQQYRPGTDRRANRGGRFRDYYQTLHNRLGQGQAQGQQTPKGKGKSSGKPSHKGKGKATSPACAMPKGKGKLKGS